MIKNIFHILKKECLRINLILNIGKFYVCLQIKKLAKINKINNRYIKIAECYRNLKLFKTSI